MYYYSSTTKGFYSSEIHGDSIPLDCVEVTQEYYSELLTLQGSGKEIKPDKDGYPVAVNPEPLAPTWEKIRVERDFLLKNSDWAVLPDATPKPSKEAWLGYRQGLRDVPQTFSTPESVVWPAKPE